MADPYTDSKSAPVISGEALTIPATGKNFNKLWVGTAGDVEVTLRDGADLMFTNVPGGCFLSVQGTGVTANTTAADIVACV